MAAKKWSQKDLNIWSKWKEQHDQDAGNQLVEKYIPLVDFVVNRLSVSLPDTVQKSDLKSLGLQGLLDAIDKFEIKRGLQFETYATFRIRGSIIDGLRKNDWVPRSVRDKSRKIEEAYIKLEQEKLRSVTDEEISEYLGLRTDEVNQVLVEASMAAMISFDEPIFDEEEHQIDRYNFTIDSNADSPEKSMDEQVLKETLAQGIERLPEQEKIVISLVYYEDMNLTEVASILNLSTSRISQLHSKGMLRLKSVLVKEDSYLNI